LSIEVTLLLQSKSEEIERISFVQQYERKVVKSKAAIQPFATKQIMADDSNEEETRSQGTQQSTRNNECLLSRALPTILLIIAMREITLKTGMEVRPSQGESYRPFQPVLVRGIIGS
jgi:hypothetical protein